MCIRDRFISAEFKGDREIVLEAVKQCGVVLCDASDDFKADREIVMEAVSQNAYALRYASDALKNGGLREYIENLINQYNVSKQTFIATILFGAKQTRQRGIQESVGPASSRPRLCDHSN